MNKTIAVSLLSADVLALADEVDMLTQAGAKRLHLDVMDQHYVNNFTFGPSICRALRKRGCELAIDVHLMVDPVRPLLEASVEAGATSVLFHQETSVDVMADLTWVRDQGCQVGLALNPNDSLSTLHPYLESCDYLLLMSVTPGFAGQGFIPETLSSLKQATTYLEQHHPHCQIMIDGGIKLHNAKAVAEAGADILVSGSGVFDGDGGPNQALRQLDQAING